MQGGAGHDLDAVGVENVPEVAHPHPHHAGTARLQRQPLHQMVDALPGDPVVGQPGDRIAGLQRRAPHQRVAPVAAAQVQADHQQRNLDRGAQLRPVLGDRVHRQHAEIAHGREDRPGKQGRQPGHEPPAMDRPEPGMPDQRADQQRNARQKK
jgi:hypothetical protein